MRRTEAVNCTTTRAWRRKEPWVVLLSFPLSTEIGLKEESTKAGYRPERMVPVMNRIARFIQKPPVVRRERVRSLPATALKTGRQRRINKKARVTARVLMRSDSKRN